MGTFIFLIVLFFFVPLLAFFIARKTLKDYLMFIKKYRRLILSSILAIMISTFLFTYRSFNYDILLSNDFNPFIMVYTGEIPPAVFTEKITPSKQEAETIKGYLIERQNIDGYFNDHYIIVMQVSTAAMGKMKRFISSDNHISINFLEKVRNRNYITNGCECGSIIAYEVEGTYKGQFINVNVGTFRSYEAYRLVSDSYYYKDGVTYREVNNELQVVRYIGQQETVTIPNQIMGMPVTRICEWSFDKNNTIKTLILPKTLKVIEDYSIYRCEALTQILVDDKSSYFTDYEGVLLTKKLNELVLYPPGAADETYVIPESVSVVRNTAFLQFYHLKRFILHENIEQMPIPGNMGAIRDYQISFSVKQGTYGETYVIENDYPFDYIE